MTEAFQPTPFQKELYALGGGTHDWSDSYEVIFNYTSIPKGTILDVCSNDRRLDFWLRERGIIAPVVSLDVERFEGTSPFVTGDAIQLPFKDKSFDTVFCCGTVFVSREVERLEEMIRVAKSRVIVFPRRKAMTDHLRSNKRRGVEVKVFRTLLTINLK